MDLCVAIALIMIIPCQRQHTHYPGYIFTNDSITCAVRILIHAMNIAESAGASKTELCFSIQLELNWKREAA